MREFVYFITPYLGIVLLYSLVRQILVCKISSWKMILCLLPTVLVHVPNWFLGNNSIVTPTVNLVFALLAYIVLPMLLFRGTKWKCLLVTAVFAATQAISDMICYTYFAEHYGEQVEQYPLAQLIYYTAVSLTLFALLGISFVLLFRMVALHRFQLFHLALLVFPLSQYMLLFYGIHSNYHPWWLLISVAFGLGADVALLGYTISLERKAALEQELQAVRHTMALERLRYEAAEEQREQLARIRHDFNNQLAVIAQLIHAGERAEAQKIICALETDINRPKEVSCLLEEEKPYA